MFEGIVPLLSLVTLLIVAVLAIISKERTKDRMRDPNAPVSTLAKDGKYGGVAFLMPLDARIAAGSVRSEPAFRETALPDELVRRRVAEEVPAYPRQTLDERVTLNLK